MVDRLVLIFDTFERSGGRLRLGQIAARTGLPRSSVHRILQQLVEARWLFREGSEYALGLRVFELGSLVAHQGRISAVAHPFLHELSIGTGHVVHLAVLDWPDVVYLDKIGGAFGAGLPSRVGGRLPAHCTAVGKALLAFSSPEVTERYLESELRGRTTASIRSRGVLRETLTRIRRAGFAAECEEALPGVACVAAPISEGGNVVAAVSLCAPREALVVADVKHRVMWTAAEISRRLAAAPRLSPGAHLVPMS